MKKNTKGDKGQGSRRNYFLTKKGRRFMREEQYLKRLSEQERMAYEECTAMVQTLSNNSSLDEVCGWLEKYILDEKD